MQKNEHKQLANFLRNGDYQSALNFLEGIEEKAKDDSDYWYYHAHIARKMDDLKQAEIFCKKALELSRPFRATQILRWELSIKQQENTNRQFRF